MSTPISALDHCFTEVKAYFAERDRADVIVWGRRELTKQTNQALTANRASRVCFVPGDDSGKAGELTMPERIGQAHEAIFGWAELCTVHVWGRDASDPDNELAHYRVCFELFEFVLRAIRVSKAGNIGLSDPKWVTKPVERVFGAALQFSLRIRGQIRNAAPVLVRTTATQVDAVLVTPSGDVPVT